ncbi:gamma-glutamylcyclotransferase [Thiofilum flexile]|uniref:gamma-glutamylcyclotransferase n=1 Tax=Thiofilum flexile TaxID=125627 RepID=UPI0003631F1D|nr:gamma-glutamylcyclotransferase [Thiofilum flexile]
MQKKASEYSLLTNKLVEHFRAIPCVEAIALGGSQSSGNLDKHSDIDLYIYSNEIIPLSTRESIVKTLGASKADLNLTFWDLGDEWFDLESGIEVDMIYWSLSWITEQLERVAVSHQASMGYTTCFWYTISNSNILFDRQGWFAQLQQRYSLPYPATLKRAIIAKNHPVLRAVIPSYYAQIKKAIERQDLVSINHRVAALFASYFDMLFAINEILNPGEKKLVAFALQKCPKLPVDFQTQVEKVLRGAATADEMLLHRLDELLDSLDDLLIKEGIDPTQTLNLTVNKLFVYGSLAPGRPNEHLLKKVGGEWVEATVRGRLVSEGWGADMGFPGIIPTPDGEVVCGYLFSSDNLSAYWDEIDQFEGAGYERVIIKAQAKDGAAVDAFIYQLRQHSA